MWALIYIKRSKIQCKSRTRLWFRSGSEVNHCQRCM